MQLNTAVKTIKRKSHRGNQGITTDQITIDIIACINESAREVQRLLPKRFWMKQSTLAFVPGVQGTPQTYSLPSDCQDLSVVSYFLSGFYYVLTKIESDIEWKTQVWNPLVPPLRPYHFREIGPDANGNKQIEVFPQSAFNITVDIEYYRVRSADLTVNNLNTEMPDYPDWYQDVLEKGGLYYFLKQFDDPRTKEAFGDYQMAKEALEEGDERDSAGVLRFRFGTMKYDLPGFRLD